MTRWIWSSLLGLLFLAPAPCKGQEDLRLYHEAWYLENVAHQPEKALEKYRRICRDFPSSPFRRNALVRQADLLRKLHRPEEAKKVLAILSREGLAREARRDLKRLDRNAGDLKRREALLRKITLLRKKLETLKGQLLQVRKKGAPPAQVGRLEKEVGELRRAIEALKPQLARTRPFSLGVKRKGLVSGRRFQEARKLGARMEQLRRQLHALRREGKKREAAQVQAELRKVQARLNSLIRSLQGRGRRYAGPGRKGARFFFRLPWGIPEKIGLLLSPERLSALDPAGLANLLRTMDRFMNFLSVLMKRRGMAGAGILARRDWPPVRKLYEKRAFPLAARKLRELLQKLPKGPWRFHPPRRRRPAVPPPRAEPAKGRLKTGKNK